MIKKRFFPVLISFFFLATIPLLLSVDKGSSKDKKSSVRSSLPSSVWAQEQLNKMSLEEKIAQFFMVAAYSNKGEDHLQEIDRLVSEYKVGGIIFFQGERENLLSSISRFQAKAKVPLLIGMDAEWGVSMRLFGEDRFPYAYTFGAANDVNLSEKMGAMMAQECRELGIHMNFSPVADVNSNPDNPVIGFRSFGENPKIVADQVSAFVKGMEGNGIMTSIKHFPGHGNTDKDSHFELPTVSQSYKTIDAIDFFPFREGIRAGASSVMIGHLNVPALDDSGTPSSLSSKVIQDYLKTQLNFNGLVISDALNMKAVADKYGKSEVVVKAFQAGCDILLFPESVGDAIALIEKKVQKGDISLSEINERCLKVLAAKHKFVVAPKTLKKYKKEEIEFAQKQVYEKAITIVKNEGDLLPLKRLDKKIARVSIGMNTFYFREGVQNFADVKHFHYFTADEAIEKFISKASDYDVILVSLHASTVRAKNNYGFGDNWQTFLTKLPAEKDVVLSLFGNPYALENVDLSKINAVVVGYENHKFVQDRMAQLIFGSIPGLGQLPVTIKNSFARGAGIQTQKSGRLKFSQPEEFGIDPEKLNEIDRIVENGISKGAFPGCQIVVAYKGSIIYRKSFGTKMYDDTLPVKNSDLYDIASVTKIAASTVGLMRLQTKGEFSLDKTLKDYLGDLNDNSYNSIRLRDMMAHQAGLTAWIPFYKRTLKNGELNSSIYSADRTGDYQLQVAKDIYIKENYVDSIYRQIIKTPLAAKTYVYSDLGYYFVKKIIEKQTDKSFDRYLMDEIYKPMGLRTLRYQPLNFFDKSRIAPTEKDMAFRKQQVHGHVHDPGAAMLGGVGGHAGLFSNATDLASLMQMILNKGSYAGVRYINESIVDEYTKAQFSGSRRGAGFDRPTAAGSGTCHELASQQSFGHSGFTGTLAWADPTYEINYVFLSNRVYPSQENWKIRDMNIRTEIQRVIYEAVKAAK
jgi:beta-glucosidase-like glycosyl hydrolase/CubicO group peptidase (beta-lactamase class C family)